MKKKIIRITTVPMSLSGLLRGQLRFISQHYNVLGVSSVGENKTLEKVAELEKIPTYAVEMTRKITPLKDLIAVWRLYKLFKKEKPFIVHSHTPKAGTLAMIASKLANVPHRLHTIAGLPLVEATGFKRKLLNTVERVTYKNATKIFPNSFGLEEIIINHKFTVKEKLKVIANGSSNGINTSFFDPEIFNDSEKNKKLCSKLDIVENDFVFVFVGRLVSDKGINELISAFNIISTEYASVKLLLVGPYEKELDSLLPETLKIINTNDNIIEAGWVEDVRPYFSISNVLTFPSYREGFPNVVMQAGAMGLPAIVTDINGCNEIIVEGENGTIIPVKNKEALYDKMKNVFLGHIKFDSKKCRDLIVERYQQQTVWDAILEEYNQLK